MGFLDRLIGKIDRALGKQPGLYPGTTVEERESSRKKRSEARGWLRRNKNPQPFAGNAFRSATPVLNLVNRLYRAGARSVKVGNIRGEEWRIASEGGPYADTLYVSVTGRAAKTKVEAVARRASADRMKWRGNSLEIWWD